MPKDFSARCVTVWVVADLVISVTKSETSGRLLHRLPCSWLSSFDLIHIFQDPLLFLIFVGRFACNMPPRVAKLERRSSDDPLTLAMAPPPNETEQEKTVRLRDEAEAKRISDMIDEELNRQRQAERRGPKPVKLLLLGE